MMINYTQIKEKREKATSYEIDGCLVWLANSKAKADEEKKIIQVDPDVWDEKLKEIEAKKEAQKLHVIGSRPDDESREKSVAFEYEVEFKENQFSKNVFISRSQITIEDGKYLAPGWVIDGAITASFERTKNKELLKALVSLDTSVSFTSEHPELLHRIEDLDVRERYINPNYYPNISETLNS